MGPFPFFLSLLLRAPSGGAAEEVVDLTRACAGTVRLTLNGWVPNGKSPSEACAPVRSDCARPPGVLHLYVKMCAGFVVGKNLLASLFVQPNITWVESYALSHPKTNSEFVAARRAGWVTTTVLRHPIDRIIAQYLATLDEVEPLASWVARHSKKPPRRGNDGVHKFWIELDNVYAKILSRGAPDLDRALAALSDFDLVIVAEWLDAPLTVAWLGDALCFHHDLGRVPKSKRPDVSRYRRARKHALEAHRRTIYGNYSWFVDARAVLAQLAARNSIDLDVYDAAAAIHRRRAEANWRRRHPTATIPALPPLPCSLPFSNADDHHPSLSAAAAAAAATTTIREQQHQPRQQRRSAAHCWHLQFEAPPPPDAAIAV